MSASSPVMEFASKACESPAKRLSLAGTLTHLPENITAACAPASRFHNAVDARRYTDAPPGRISSIFSLLSLTHPETLWGAKWMSNEIRSPASVTLPTR
jgi:hypothetical protein